MNYLGDFAVGQKVFCWFNTFAGDPPASVTMTDLSDGDVHIHKDDSLIQRNNAAGVDVDIDVDTIAGVHKITIDTNDNTVADFYEAGHDYFVRIEGAKVDDELINPVVATFSIANRRVAGEMCRSSIEALIDQSNFTLTAGEASVDNDAYNNCTVVVTDQTTRTQKAVGYVKDYVGSTRALVLHADPLATGFTMAPGDSVEILATGAFSNMVALSGNTTSADNLEESALAIVPATCEGSPSTTVIKTDLSETIDDHFVGRIAIFLDSPEGAPAAFQATTITDYVGSTGTITVTELTTAPVSGNKLVVL
jgi:hypothetical protein